MSAAEYLEADRLWTTWHSLQAICAIEPKGGLARMEAARALRLFLRVRRGL